MTTFEAVLQNKCEEYEHLLAEIYELLDTKVDKDLITDYIKVLIAQALRVKGE
jgi:hypothetical protein